MISWKISFTRPFAEQLRFFFFFFCKFEKFPVKMKLIKRKISELIYFCCPKSKYANTTFHPHWQCHPHCEFWSFRCRPQACGPPIDRWPARCGTALRGSRPHSQQSPQNSHMWLCEVRTRERFPPLGKFCDLRTPPPSFPYDFSF